MAEPVPDKGRVLTAMSAFWFEKFEGVVGNHLVSTTLDGAARGGPEARVGRPGDVVSARRDVAHRVHRAGLHHRLGLEGVPRRRHDARQRLPEGLLESSQLPEPVFTPSTKAEDGDHDMNISFEQAAELVGPDIAARARDVSLELYTRGAAWAAERGIIIADTKFELGFVDDELVLADEVLTPDSSRFWPADAWKPGSTPPSFDKQPVRDYLDTLDWDKKPPPPPLPVEVVDASRARYVEAYERVTGRSFADWHG